MRKTLVQERGVKLARKVIEQAERWTARDLKAGHIDQKTYDERMERIKAEREACGL